MNVTLDKLPALVQEELDAANRDNPPFHSLHEAYGVLTEEVEETKELMELLDLEMRDFWGATRCDDMPRAGRIARGICHDATEAAAELLQVAAMAQKAYHYVRSHKAEEAQHKNGI